MMKLMPTLWEGSPAKVDKGMGAMAVYMYSLKKRPYTVMIIMNDSTQINSPPMSVTAHRGMDSKNPASSTAVMISVGSTVSCGAPNPPAVMMEDTTP